MSTLDWVGTATTAFEDALSDLLGSTRLPDDPVDAGRRAALDAVSGAMWTDHLGPFLDTDGVMTLLGGISKQAVHDRVRRHRLLALRTGAGRLAYPTFQFQRHAVVEGLGEVLSVVAPDDTEAWFVAAWLRTADPALDGSPIEALREGRRADVVDAARDVAAALRG